MKYRSYNVLFSSYEKKNLDATEQSLSRHFFSTLLRFIKDFFDEAKNFLPRRDPLVLDLDGDGIETVSATGAVLFDHDGDGVRSGTGWISSDDGILVLDRNGNGLIDSGRELFGADTVLSDGSTATSGFAALADLDRQRHRYPA